MQHKFIRLYVYGARNADVGIPVRIDTIVTLRRAEVGGTLVAVRVNDRTIDLIHAAESLEQIFELAADPQVVTFD
jgi:hypothetical protein